MDYDDGENSNRDAGRVQEALGQSDSFLSFQERLSRAAKVDRPVLLVGERGTGKELAASRVHYLSTRWKEPFITLNCATLSPTLIESELFGHEAGAFTGARGRREGRFEAADGGTLFLDELGAVPVEAQEKILRVVEYGTFERVGGSQPIHVDVRIVAATNANLPVLAMQGRFKQDLLDRLSFEVLFLPPLRERKEDVMLLAEYFTTRMAAEMALDRIPEFSDEAVAALENYAWPGNVRELKNVIERCVYRADEDVITEIVFDPFDSPFAPVAAPVPASSSESGAEPTAAAVPARPFKETIEDLERSLIRDALVRSNYNQKKAANLLGLTYDQFRGYYRKYMNQES